MAHIGSWGTPDFGLTELVNRGVSWLRGVNPPTTPQGGSQLFISPFSQRDQMQIQELSTPVVYEQPSVQRGTQTTATTTNRTAQPQNWPQEQPQRPQEQPQEDTKERIRQEIEGIYSPLMSYLNQAEGAVTEEYSRYRPELEQQYAASLSNIQTQRAQGERELASQEEAARTRREDALSAARRLYDELRRGGLQRFGGASSAGQAFTELTAQEQQRQSGNIWQAFQQTQDNINKYKANLLENFAQAQKELDLAKTSALQEAYNNYNNRLLEIRRMKGEAESSKARAIKEELENLRNKVYQINLQNLNLAQNLAANRQMALSYVDRYSQAVAQSILGGSTSYQNLVNATTTKPTSNTTIGGGQATAVAPQTGVLAYKRPEDYLLGL